MDGIRGANDERLFGVLVTYRRPAALDLMLQRLSEQRQRIARLVVVDNAASPETARIVSGYEQDRDWLEYVPSPENLGPAGGIAIGMERVLAYARADDWMVLLDDDDPPQWPSVLAELLAFGQAMRQVDDRTAAVGLAGARFDWKRGRLIRPRDEELTGPVAVDYVGGNQLPLYLVGAVQSVGTFSTPLFFGFDDLEYGLRLRRAGYSLYASGPTWLEQRRRQGRANLVVRPSLGLGAPTWRRYYGLRNTIHILRRYGRTGAAVRVTGVQGLVKPLVNAARSPRRAWRHLELTMAASRDGWTGRLGRTVDPDDERSAEVTAPSGGRSA